MSDQPCCAHLHASYRSEQVEYDFGPRSHEVDTGLHARPFGIRLVTRGWWECDSGCGARFAVIPRPGSISGPYPPDEDDVDDVDEDEASRTMMYREYAAAMNENRTLRALVSSLEADLQATLARRSHSGDSPA